MKVLTLAEKKSLLPADVSVRVSATREAAAVGPSAELLGPIRNYLGVAAHLPHSIGQSVSKARRRLSPSQTCSFLPHLALSP